MLLDMPSMNSTLDKGRAIVPLNRVDAVLSSAKEARKACDWPNASHAHEARNCREASEH